MRPAKTSRAEAVVLKGFDYGETDKILTLYTPDEGKVRAIAKGVRRVTSRLGGHVDLFAHASVLLVHGRNMEIVTQGQARHTFPRLRDSLDALTKACYVAELVDRFTEDGQANPALFRALVRALERIDAAVAGVGAVAVAGVRSNAALRLFELQLLALSGYRPQLHSCLSCDTPIEPGANAFDPALGGVLCPACAPAHASAHPISTDALKLLRNLQGRGEAFLSVAVPEAALAEAEDALGLYIQYLLERRPNAATFLDMLRRVESA